MGHLDAKTHQGGVRNDELRVGTKVQIAALEQRSFNAGPLAIMTDVEFQSC